MGRRRPFSLRLLVALSALVAALGAAPVPRSVTGPADDLAFIPADSPTFSSVRLSRVLKRLRLNPTRPKGNILGEMQKQLGLDLASVERLSCADPVGTEGKVLVVLTSEPISKKRLLAAVAPKAKRGKCRGRVVYSSPSGWAVHFVRPNLALLAERYTGLARVLEWKDVGKAKPRPGFAEALADATRHDVTAWGSVVALGGKREEAEKALECHAGKVCVDFGSDLKVDAQAYFANASAAQRASQLVPAGLDLGRCATLYGSAMCGLIPGAVKLKWAAIEDVKLSDPQLRALTRAAGLFHQAEQGFATAKVGTDGARLHAEFAFPLSTHDIRSAMSCTRTMLGDGALNFDKLELGFVNRYSSDPNARTAELLNNSEESGVIEKKQEPARLIASGEQASSNNAVPAPYAPESQQALPGPPPELKSAPPAVPAKQPTHKLTVANVRKEGALICTYNEKNELTFSAKIGDGDAVDLTTRPGQRWAAVFSQSQDAVNFTAGDKEEIWLIRAPAPLPLSSTMSTATSAADPQPRTAK